MIGLTIMVMKKFINRAEDLTKELLEGFAEAHKGLVELLPVNTVVNRKLEDANRVTIMTMGGAGHEPALSGFVGEGMADISVVGDIFSSPGPEACVDAIRLADKGKGVLFVVLNHAGDMLTGNLAMKQASKEGLNVIKVVIQEDIASAPRENSDERRGLVGCVPVYKIVGAAAAEGKTLKEIASIAQDFTDNMATLAVAVKTATHPATSEEFMQLADDEMEVGMGQHGEGGGGRQKMKSADETAVVMCDALISDLSLKSGEKIMLVLNGVGATTLMELFIIYRKCVAYLKSKGIETAANYVGELLTVQEQAGFQMFMARMNDQYLQYWHAPCRTPYMTK
jgi:dihydroxyacetone kinase-like protein